MRAETQKYSSFFLFSCNIVWDAPTNLTFFATFASAACRTFVLSSRLRLRLQLFETPPFLSEVRRPRTLPEAVAKGQSPFATRGLQAGRSPLPCMRGVISAAHVTGNDGFPFVSAVRGGNSTKFFVPLQPCYPPKEHRDLKQSRIAIPGNMHYNLYQKQIAAECRYGKERVIDGILL